MSEASDNFFNSFNFGHYPLLYIFETMSLNYFRSTTDGAASEKPNSFELFRVVTDEDNKSSKNNFVELASVDCRYRFRSFSVLLSLRFSSS